MCKLAWATNAFAVRQTPKAGWEAGAPREFQLANHRLPRDKPATFLPKPMKLNLLATLALAFAAGLIPARAQINTGSDGQDGAFKPTQSTVIDMADHPYGIYHLPAPTLRDTMQP